MKRGTPMKKIISIFILMILFIPFNAKAADRIDHSALQYTEQVAEKKEIEITRINEETKVEEKVPAIEPQIKVGQSANGAKDLLIYQPVRIGDKITYNISGVNYHTEVATIRIIDVLDSNVEIVSEGTTGGYTLSKSVEGKTIVTWELSETQAQTAVDVTLTVKVLESASAVGKINNQARATVGLNNTFDEESWTNEIENSIEETVAEETPEEETKGETEVKNPETKDYIYLALSICLLAAEIGAIIYFKKEELN